MVSQTVTRGYIRDAIKSSKAAGFSVEDVETKILREVVQGIACGRSEHPDIICQFVLRAIADAKDSDNTTTLPGGRQIKRRVQK